MSKAAAVRLKDVQSQADPRGIAIRKVGIRSLRMPLCLVDADGSRQQTVGTVSAYVDLGGEVRGTHMSRFIEIFSEARDDFSLARFRSLPDEVRRRLGSWGCDIEVDLDFFKFKKAPVSGVESWIDNRVRFAASAAGDGSRCMVTVEVPVATLCPCSKEISDYGAHNQRSGVTVRIEPPADRPLSLGEVVDIVERNSSVELYGVLKRQDEKFVTERAYDNPKFVEDIVRDISGDLRESLPWCEHSVSAENFESIHNHSAYAEVVSEGFRPLG